MKSLLKIYTVIIFIIFFSINNFSADKLKWNENLDEAIQIAKKENKTILLNFTGSDWCIWCKKLNSEVFTQKDFIDYANKNLILVKIDFPKNIKQSKETVKYNQGLAKKLKIQGFPTIILLNNKAEIVAYTGYQEGGAKSYIEHIKSFL